MGDQRAIEDLFSFSADNFGVDYPELSPQLDPESYKDFFSPLGTPPNQVLGVQSPNDKAEAPSDKDPNYKVLCTNVAESSPLTLPSTESPSTVSGLVFQKNEVDLNPRKNLTPVLNSGFVPGYQNEIDQDLNQVLGINEVESGKQSFNCGAFQLDVQDLLELGRAVQLPSAPSQALLPLATPSSKENLCGSDVLWSSNREKSLTLEELFMPRPKENNEFNNQQGHAAENVQNVSENNATDDEDLNSRNSGEAMNEIVPRAGTPAIDIDALLRSATEGPNGREGKSFVKKRRKVHDCVNAELSGRSKRLKRMNVSGSNDPLMAEELSAKRLDLRRKKGSGLDVEESIAAVQGVLAPRQSSPSSTPSRFCHICTRAAKPDVILVCDNVSKGTCRKVICFKCIREMSWDWSSLQGNEAWTCTHCRKVSWIIE